MKKLNLLGSACIVLLALSCKKEKITAPSSLIDATKAITCVQEPTTSSQELLKRRGPNIDDVGDVHVWNDNDYIYVRIDAISSFDNSKLFLGDCAAVPSPLTGSHNNIDHAPAVTSYTYMFPNTYASGDEVCISATVSGNRNASGSHVIEEICACQIEIGDFRTQSKGGWGASPNGDNSAQLLHDNWDLIGSIQIGCGGVLMEFNSAEAVDAYLPNGNGADSPFDSNLATQVLALSISIAMDAQLADFGAAEGSLACLIIQSVDPQFAAFNGMSVLEVLQLANDILGGCSSDYTFDEMTAIIEALNLNFHGGDTDNGLLTCGTC